MWSGTLQVVTQGVSDWRHPGVPGTDRAEKWSLFWHSGGVTDGQSQRASHTLGGLYWINKVSMTSVVSAQGCTHVTLCLSLMLAQGGPPVTLCVMVLPRPADPAWPTSLRSVSL